MTTAGRVHQLPAFETSRTGLHVRLNGVNTRTCSTQRAGEWSGRQRGSNAGVGSVVGNVSDGLPRLSAPANLEVVLPGPPNAAALQPAVQVLT